MSQSLTTVALVVRDYDEAIAFYVGVLAFTLVEDALISEQNKRWVVVAPAGSDDRPCDSGGDRTQFQHISSIRITGFILASTSFILSLMCETLLYDRDSTFLIGIICLVFGWDVRLSWYAIPLLFLSALFLMRHR